MLFDLDVAGPWRLHLVVVADKASHSGQLWVLCKKSVEQKSRATVNQSIKVLLGCKFRVQNLLHEPKMLLMSLTHLVARMGWAHAKSPKETDLYPPNHTSSISPNMSHGLGPRLKE